MLNLWDSLVEKSEYAQHEEFLIPIRKLRWLAPQESTNDGVLFALLGEVNSEAENLKSSLVGFITTSTGALSQVLAIPPTGGEAILSFSLVSSQDKDAASVSTTGRKSPALLLFTQDISSSEISDSSIIRYLKTIRCPCSSPKDWVLEIGLLPDPSKVPDILPHVASVTAMTAVNPKTSLTSFSNVLLATAGDLTLCSSLRSVDIGEVESPNGKRMSMTAFEGFDVTEDLSWKLVLATTTSQLNQGYSAAGQPHDIVFLGHSDGNVFAWNIVPVEKSGSRDQGSGSMWTPLNAFKCGTAAITVISHENNLGVLAAGNESGTVTVWEIYETGSDIGATAYFSTQESERRPFHPNSIRQIYQTSTGGDSISSITMILDSETVVVGTDSGKLYVSLDWGSNTLCGSTQLTAATIGASGGVINTMYSTYWKMATNTAVPAVFVLFESGHIAVVNFTMMTFIACCPPPLGMNPSDKVSFSDYVNSGFESVWNDAVENVDKSLFPEKAEQSQSALSEIFKSRDRSASHIDDSMFPKCVPRYLLYIRGKMIYTYDIAKFSNLGPRFTTSNIPAPGDQWVSARKLTDASILCAEKFAYIEEASRAWAEPIMCLASIDSDGAFYVHSFKDKAPICSVDLFLGVCDNSSPLKRGLVLPNGSCYVQQGDFMVHTGSTVCSDYILNAPSPAKVAVRLSLPDISLQLDDGRPPKSAAAKQRRMSIMSAAPVDLSKVFIKTRDEHQKDELFGRRVDDDEQDVDSAATRALKVAAETREALLERGRKLQQLTKCSEVLGSSSQDFRQHAKDQNQKLKEKHANWGLF